MAPHPRALGCRHHPLSKEQLNPRSRPLLHQPIYLPPPSSLDNTITTSLLPYTSSAQLTTQVLFSISSQTTSVTSPAIKQQQQLAPEDAVQGLLRVFTSHASRSTIPPPTRAKLPNKPGRATRAFQFLYATTGPALLCLPRLTTSIFFTSEVFYSTHALITLNSSRAFLSLPHTALLVLVAGYCLLRVRFPELPPTCYLPYYLASLPASSLQQHSLNSTSSRLRLQLNLINPLSLLL